MNLLIDIGHPAHVHLYRHSIREMEGRGHKVLVTVKNVEASKKLLGLFRIPFIEIGEKSDSLTGKALNQLRYNSRLRKLVREHDIAFGMGTSITVAHVSRLTGMRSVVFDDDDDRVEPLFVYFAHPFADHLLSPDALRGLRRKRGTIYYAGYHELAYLHPRRFAPDPSVPEEIGVKAGEKYFLLRFNAFKAHHDIGVSGLAIADKRRLVSVLQRRGKVFITMERELDPEFERFRLKISPEKIHSLLYYATMLVGDSQTMTSEAAVLGTPALKCNSFAGRLAVPNELESKYQLCFSYPHQEAGRLFEKMDELLAERNVKELWLQRRERMLREKIDVTAFMAWFIENLPASAAIMEKDPGYPMRFQ